MATKDFGKILLGEGILTYNDGTSDVELGFVRNGSFNDNATVRHVDVTGKSGNTKGDAILEDISPVLEFDLVQMESSVIEKVFVNGVISGTGAATKFTRTTGRIAEDQYLTNVTYKGVNMDGKDITIVVLNAIGEGPVNLAFGNRTEVQIPCSFTGNMENTTTDVAPYEIIMDEA